MTFKSCLITCCFFHILAGSCNAQSIAKDSQTWPPFGNSNSPAQQGATTSDIGDKNDLETIFKGDLSKDSAPNLYLRNRPSTPHANSQTFPDAPAGRGGVDQGYVGPFNTPTNNPKGVYLGIDMPIGGK